MTQKPEGQQRPPKYPAPAAPDNEVFPERVAGEADETHQRAEQGGPVLTDQQGHPVADNQNTISAGVNGPKLLQDQFFRDKIFAFDHERIPERVVHARGSGAHGVFETYESLSDLTCADLFQRAGEKTEVFVRFSTVAGNKGSADVPRDIRGFAVKFYTKEGNWDLVGNNAPVFFIQDAIKFPDLVHAVKEEPDRGFPQAASAHDTFWDFVSLQPEAMHAVIWLMSDRAIPRALRFQEGFGVHTFRFVNAQGESHYVKFHWKPVQGMQSVTWPEAVSINGADPDFHRRDLWDSITNGDFPQWELGVQVFDDAFADSFEFDILDPTKIIPEEQVPVRPIGKMTLNGTTVNHFAETEQVAFMTQNVVRGIDFTNDPLLQGRNFSYLDTQLKRLGSTNFTQIPVNRPKAAEVSHFHMDGHMQMDPQAVRAAYEPNSFTGAQRGPREVAEQAYQPYATPVQGTVRQVRPESFADHYSQAGQFYRSQTKVEQEHIASAYAFELGKCEIPQIRERVLSHLVHIDKELATTVAQAIGMELPEPFPAKVEARTDLAASDALSILKNGPKDFGGRKLGLLVGDGTDAQAFDALVKAVTAVGGNVEVIARAVGGVSLSDGSKQAAGQSIKGTKAALYDAVAVLVTPEAAAEYAKLPAGRDFLTEAQANFKIIGHTDGAKALADAAGVTPDAGWVDLSDAQAAVKKFGELRFWDRDTSK